MSKDHVPLNFHSLWLVAMVFIRYYFFRLASGQKKNSLFHSFYTILLKKIFALPYGENCVTNKTQDNHIFQFSELRYTFLRTQWIFIIH